MHLTKENNFTNHNLRLEQEVFRLNMVAAMFKDGVQDAIKLRTGKFYRTYPPR